MSTTSRHLLQAFLLALLFVAVLSLLGLMTPIFHYPLFPGIAAAGVIFSSGVESDHRLRFEVAAVFINVLIYGAVIYLLLRSPQQTEAPQRVRHTPGRLE